VTKQRSKQVVTDKSRCTVRECDETEKGKFIAYVDEKNESYDVSISLDSEKKLVNYSCDCGSENEKFCNHVQALLHHVNVIQPKKSQLPGFKTRGLKSVLDQADPGSIKDWLWKLLSTNDEVKLLFENVFDPPTHYDPGKVLDISRNTRKAIIGEQLYPSQKTLARFAKSLVTVHTPIIRFYLQAPFEQEYYDAIKSILGYLDELSGHIELTKLLAGYNDMLTPISEGLRQINDESLFKRAVGYFLSDLKPDLVSGNCVMRLFSLLIKSLEIERARHLLTELASVFSQYNFRNNDYIVDSIGHYLGCLRYHNLFHEFGYMVPAALVDKQTNQQILDHLVDSGNLAAASERCRKMLNNWLSAEEKIHLLQQLKSITISIGDKKQIVQVLAELVPQTYDYSDFKLLRDNIEAQKFLEIRKQLIANATMDLYKSPAKFRFAFQLFEEEKNYERMLRFLHRTNSYQIVESSFESLIAFDRIICLQQMFAIRDQLGPDSDYNASNDEFLSVKRLVNITLKNYQEDEIRFAIKQHHRNNSRQFTSNYYIKMLADSVQL
jgi:hypothetical protein